MIFKHLLNISQGKLLLITSTSYSTTLAWWRQPSTLLIETQILSQLLSLVTPFVASYAPLSIPTISPHAANMGMHTQSHSGRNRHALLAQDIIQDLEQGDMELDIFCYR